MRRHDDRVGVATQTFPGLVEDLDDGCERGVAHHQDVHVTAPVFLSPGDGPEHEREVDLRGERGQGVAQDIGQAGRLAEDRRQVLEDDGGPVGLIAYLIAGLGASHEPGLGQAFQFPVEGAGRRTGEPGDFADVEAFVRVQEQMAEDPAAILAKQEFDRPCRPRGRVCSHIDYECNFFENT